MQRDGFACQICGDKETTLHVHHLHYIPDRAYWDYEDWELITLCENCHKNEHSTDDLLECIGRLKSRGITLFEIVCLLEDIDVRVYLGNHTAILDITGNGIGVFDYNEIKRLTERRIKSLPVK